jgi:hypothetical protein
VADDAIATVGDTDPEWLACLDGFADLEADVILLVYRNDGFARIGAAALADQGLFMQLCHLVVTRQALHLEPHMTRQFGAKFRQRYRELCERDCNFKPKDRRHPHGA